MQSAALHPPKTLLEVYRMLPEGTRAELINDQLFMSPAPTSAHQRTIFKITGQMYVLLEKNAIGELYPSPIDVFLDDKKNACQPDLVFVLNKNLKVVKRDGIYGAPDLIIEVLSPGTEKFHKETKKKIYEKSGVKEYWIIDPDTKECKGYQLKNSKYILFSQEKTKFTSALLKHSFKF
jgi:Uma2 family endonuclease